MFASSYTKISSTPATLVVDGAWGVCRNWCYRQKYAYGYQEFLVILLLAAMLLAADSVNVWTFGPTNVSSGASFAMAQPEYATAVPYCAQAYRARYSDGVISNTIRMCLSGKR